MATSVLWRETATGYVRYAFLQGVLRVTGYGQPEPPLAGYFVSATDGDDANDGSLEAPFRTITRGIAAALPGQTVYVRGGNYVELIRLTRSGTSDSPITIRNYPGETPVVDGAYTLPEGTYVITVPETGRGLLYSALVTVTGDYIVWDGINVTRSRGEGIRVEGNHFEIRNCDISHHFSACLLGTYPGGTIVYHTGFAADNVIATYANEWLDGVKTWQPTYTWTGSIHTICYNSVKIVNCVTAGRGEGINLWRGSTGLIQGNTCYDSFNCGIWVPNSSYVTVDRNLVYTSDNVIPSHGIGTGIDRGYGANWVVEPNHHNTFTNNIVVGSRSGFLYAVFGDTPTPELRGLDSCVIANNTFVHANLNGKLASGTWGMGTLVIEDKGVITQTVVKNNIFLQDTSKAPLIYGSGHSLCSFSNNAWYPNRPDTCSGGVSDVLADPRLNNATAPIAAGGGNPQYYALRPDSPCRDAGTNVEEVTEDFWETTRPQYGVYDIGAHEYGQPLVG